MPYIIAFALILGGYTLLDWGHYVAAGHRVSLWYLISGQTQQQQKSGGSSSNGSSTAAPPLGWKPGRNV